MTASMDLAVSTTGSLAEVGTALAFFGLLTGLGFGHLLGDVILQTEAQAQGKGLAADDRLAAGVHPWHGWTQNLRHCSSYLAAQVCTSLIVAQVVPLTWPGLATALSVSGSTHAVIDRRWPVRWIVARKRCTGWNEVHFWTDQSLHAACLLVAAALAARVTTCLGAALTTGAGLLLIAVALRYEARHARGVAASPAPTDRL